MLQWFHVLTTKQIKLVNIQQRAPSKVGSIKQHGTAMLKKNCIAYTYLTKSYNGKFQMIVTIYKNNSIEIKTTYPEFISTDNKKISF